MALKTASVLAFERKLNASDALMYAGNWDDRDASGKWPGVVVREKSVRGTISNRLKAATASDPAKVDAEVQKPNLQTVDAAALPANCDTLNLRFSLRVLGGIGVPSACNSHEYQAKLQQTVEGYLKRERCAELARRYACNLANGRFLWRNRVGAEEISVQVSLAGNETRAWLFDAYDYPLDSFPDDAERQSLAEEIQRGLMSEGHCLLVVDAFVKLGPGQEVYPSQELVQDKTKSKHLYHVGGTAAMHSQKIGNALRTIDTWYPGAEEGGAAIAVEPYGSVTSRGVAHRQPKSKQDFYNLLDAWILKDKEPPLEQQHYVMATLVRGGVFGEAG